MGFSLKESTQKDFKVLYGNRWPLNKIPFDVIVHVSLFGGVAVCIQRARQLIMIKRPKRILFNKIATVARVIEIIIIDIYQS